MKSIKTYAVCACRRRQRPVPGSGGHSGIPRPGTCNAASRVSRLPARGASLRLAGLQFTSPLPNPSPARGGAPGRRVPNLPGPLRHPGFLPAALADLLRLPPAEPHAASVPVVRHGPARHPRRRGSPVLRHAGRGRALAPAPPFLPCACPRRPGTADPCQISPAPAPRRAGDGTLSGRPRSGPRYSRPFAGGSGGRGNGLPPPSGTAPLERIRITSP